jgi:pimeloyl-ACP methyl ester carboxylesterase
MGGMLATRFTLMFPSMVQKLILEDPIGLEDYKTFVPYQSLDTLYDKEKKATYGSYKKYQQTYYPEWKPEYEQYVQAQAIDLSSPQFDSIAHANAITYQMIYEQPVLYEFSNIKAPVLLVIGQADRTVVGKDLLENAAKNKYGNYPSLGKSTHDKIKGSLLKELPGIGHIPHVQDIKMFEESIKDFLP